MFIVFALNIFLIRPIQIRNVRLPSVDFFFILILVFILVFFSVLIFVIRAFFAAFGGGSSNSVRDWLGVRGFVFLSELRAPIISVGSIGWFALRSHPSFLGNALAGCVSGLALSWCWDKQGFNIPAEC